MMVHRQLGGPSSLLRWSMNIKLNKEPWGEDCRCPGLFRSQSSLESALSVAEGPCLGDVLLLSSRACYRHAQEKGLETSLSCPGRPRSPEMEGQSLWTPVLWG